MIDQIFLAHGTTEDIEEKKRFLSLDIPNMKQNNYTEYETLLGKFERSVRSLF